MLARRKTMLDRLNRARDGGIERPIGNGNGNSTGAPDWPFVRGNPKTDDALPYGKKGSVRRLLHVAWPEKLGAMRIRCDTYLYGILSSIKATLLDFLPHLEPCVKVLSRDKNRFEAWAFS
jgi:hypothetical protein